MKIRALEDRKRIMPKLVTRDQCEDFLYHEAELLDEWRLEEWLDLFTSDSAYLIPAMDAAKDADPAESLFYIADDRERLGERVKRLMKKTAHAEYPHSRCQRMVSNVRIHGASSDRVDLMCNFVTYRTKSGVTDTFIGHHKYILVPDGKGFKIREKRTILALDALRPQGKISLIL